MKLAVVVLLVVVSLSHGSFAPSTEKPSSREHLLKRSASKVEQSIGSEYLEKMKSTGCMDIHRAVKIKGEPVDTAEKNMITSSDTKIVHFQRHGQGVHNVVYESWGEQGKVIDWDSTDPSQNPLVLNNVFDAPLTDLGEEQCKARSNEASILNPEIMIVSPLLRAIQSAELTWRSYTKSNNGNIPWVAHEGCREEAGLLVCNKRRKLSEIRQLYPNIDFSNIETEEDALFQPDRRESDVEKANRIYDFLQFIRSLPQKEIAVVCHSAWLFNMCNAVMEIEDQSLCTWFSTAEIRSMRLTFTDV